jgi:hypothetical protein
MAKRESPASVRRETLDALPATLTMLRRLVVTTFDATDPEIDELKCMLEACVVGAHRLRLREQMRADEALEHG